jgi:hypothetical protein
MLNHFVGQPFTDGVTRQRRQQASDSMRVDKVNDRPPERDEVIGTAI